MVLYPIGEDKPVVVDDDGKKTDRDTEQLDSIKGLMLIGGNVRAGSTGANGSLYDVNVYEDWGSILGFSVGASFDYAITDFLWAMTGLSVVKKGMWYELDLGYGDWIVVEEDIFYVQIPVMVRFGNRFFGAAGLGLNLAVSSGGEFYNDSIREELSSSYYDDMTSFNISILLSGGFQFLVGPLIVGIEVWGDYHLLNDWDINSYDSHYFWFGGGGYVKYPLMLGTK